MHGRVRRPERSAQQGMMGRWQPRSRFSLGEMIPVMTRPNSIQQRIRCTALIGMFMDNTKLYKTKMVEIRPAISMFDRLRGVGSKGDRERWTRRVVHEETNRLVVRELEEIEVRRGQTDPGARRSGKPRQEEGARVGRRATLMRWLSFARSRISATSSPTIKLDE